MTPLDTIDKGAGESPRITGIAAARERVVAVDMAFFRMLAALKLPKAATLLLVLLVRIGDGYIWAFIALYLWWAIPFKELETAVLQCCFAILISLCIYAPVKVLTKRRRPYDLGLEVTPLVPPLDKYSFPSGHTMNNLAVSLTLALNIPSLILPAIVLPVSFGILRVFFGVHFLSDIVAGIGLGFMAFLLAAMTYPALGF